MNDLSVRGVYRRYLVEPRVAFFGIQDPTIVGDPNNISVTNDILVAGTGWLRPQLEPLAFTTHGPAEWHQNVCDSIRGRLAYDQTWTHIDVRIMLNPDAGVTPGVLTTLQDRWQTGIEGTWNNPVPSPGATPRPWTCSRTGEVPCRISVKVHWVTSNPHHFVAVHVGSGRADEFDWYTNDPGSTAAHEFGHMLGLPDEYASSNCPGRAPVGTGTIMDNASNFIPQRMVQFVATEIGSDMQ